MTMMQRQPIIITLQLQARVRGMQEQSRWHPKKPAAAINFPCISHCIIKPQIHTNPTIYTQQLVLVVYTAVESRAPRAFDADLSCSNWIDGRFSNGGCCAAAVCGSVCSVWPLTLTRIELRLKLEVTEGVEVVDEGVVLIMGVVVALLLIGVVVVACGVVVVAWGVVVVAWGVVVVVVEYAGGWDLPASCTTDALA